MVDAVGMRTFGEYRISSIARSTPAFVLARVFVADDRRVAACGQMRRIGGSWGRIRDCCLASSIAFPSHGALRSGL